MIASITSFLTIPLQLLPTLKSAIAASRFTYGGPIPNTWTPIPASDHGEGDLTVALLAPNSVVYDKPVTDLFYPATRPKSYIDISGDNSTYYAPDDMVSAIACLDQHQFCNPVNQKCTQLSAAAVLAGSDEQLNLSSAQDATIQRIACLLILMMTVSSSYTRGANGLRASDTVNDNVHQIGLLNTQWITEVSYWFSISMAKLQQKILQYPTDSPYVPHGYSVFGPETEEGKETCNNQMVRSANDNTSFSTLGITLILVIGAILIMTSLLLDTMRLAYEEAGQGHWTGGASSVPVTKKAIRWDYLGVWTERILVYFMFTPGPIHLGLKRKD
ncbi:MAG: hypothetical protein Q9170_005487 [Blastenia crenularia]